MWSTWWFEIVGEDSELCGQQFFVEVDIPLDKAKREAIQRAHIEFPNEKLTCYGRVSQTDAEYMGLDTY